MKKLNVGCGSNIIEGWDNLDYHTKYNANIIHNLNDLPLPFDNNYYDEIYCSHVLEHINDSLELLLEIVRILKHGGILTIKVPNETYIWNCLDHKKGFNISSLISLSCYDKDMYYNSGELKVIDSYYYSGCKSVKGIKANILKSYLDFSALFCNIFTYRIIDRTFLKYLFPQVNICVKFIKLL